MTSTTDSSPTGNAVIERLDPSKPSDRGTLEYAAKHGSELAKLVLRKYRAGENR